MNTCAEGRTQNKHTKVMEKDQGGQAHAAEVQRISTLQKNAYSKIPQLFLHVFRMICLIQKQEVHWTLVIVKH